jgi:hypothetical protein
LIEDNDILLLLVECTSKTSEKLSQCINRTRTYGFHFVLLDSPASWKMEPPEECGHWRVGSAF